VHRNERRCLSVLGLLFHAAEHAQRHVGQLVTTSKVLSALLAGAIEEGTRP